MAKSPISSTQPGVATGALLQRHGIYPTRQRLAIGRVLFARHQHLAADCLLELVNRRRPRVSRATVYNTLGLFVKKGLVREIVVDGERIFYDSNTRPHHHIYNLDTNRLVDLPQQDVDLRCIKGVPENVEMVDVNVVIRVRNAPHATTS
ncbi:MAG: Fur family transcriptional regulator [Pseudomonadota bacterium]|nr:Fur family transcriptional regulator [Pseudomonadota bacterium]